jgi:hypothetical protein
LDYRSYHCRRCLTIFHLPERHGQQALCRLNANFVCRKKQRGLNEPSSTRQQKRYWVGPAAIKTMEKSRALELGSPPNIQASKSPQHWTYLSRLSIFISVK